MRNVILMVIAGMLLWVYLQRQGGDGFGLSAYGGEANSAGPGQQDVDCRIPYGVRIGAIDEAFRMSRADLERALGEAFGVWESHARVPLFELSEDASATPVHLRFDERQARSDEMAVERMAQQDIAAEIDRMRAELEDRRRDFESRQAAFQDQADRYASAVRSYEQWMAAFNRSPSRSEAEQRRLTAERDALEQESRRLGDLQQQQRLEQEQFNARIETFNRAVVQLNDRSSAAAAATAGHGPVGAGRFTRTAAGERIEVYLVTSYPDLVLTLAHELGHALGMGHVAGASSVMSAVNSGPSSGRSDKLVLSSEDRAALEAVCAGRL